ncbi:MAG: type IV pilus modification PilV family protein [Planctomycetota bacterium]|jgi:Tfp pilus assembly protein PilV
MCRKLKIVNRKSKIKNRLAAFTLTEVVIASALLIIAIVPILKALTTAHASGRIIERKTRCLILAQAKLDDIRARAIYDYTGSFAEMNTSLGGSYLCCVTDSAHGTGLRMIGVLVGYDLNDNNLLTPDYDEELEVALATLIAERI